MNQAPPSSGVDDHLLVAYLDRELDPSTRLIVEASIRRDTALRRRLLDLMRADALLRAAFAEERTASVPPALTHKIDRALAARSRMRLMRFIVPVAAAIAGLIIGGAIVSNGLLPFGGADGGNPIRQVLDEVAEYHGVFEKETVHLVEVDASQTAEIESWLGSRVGLPLQVPDLGDRGLTFRGGRMLVLGGQPVAQLIYTDQSSRRIALCVASFPGHSALTTEHLDEDGLTLIGQIHDEHVLIVVGPTYHPILDQLSKALPTLLIRS